MPTHAERTVFPMFLALYALMKLVFAVVQRDDTHVTMSSKRPATQENNGKRYGVARPCVNVVLVVIGALSFGIAGLASPPRSQFRDSGLSARFLRISMAPPLSGVWGLQPAELRRNYMAIPHCPEFDGFGRWAVWNFIIY